MELKKHLQRNKFDLEGIKFFSAQISASNAYTKLLTVAKYDFTKTNVQYIKKAIYRNLSVPAKAFSSVTAPIHHHKKQM